MPLELEVAVVKQMMLEKSQETLHLLREGECTLGQLATALGIRPFQVREVIAYLSMREPVWERPPQGTHHKLGTVYGILY